MGTIEETTAEVMNEGRSLRSELFAGLEWAALKASPVYYGFGVPHGEGAPVVLVPGFLGSDLSLLELHLWLGRMGYRSHLSGIGVNADCPDTLLARLQETIDGVYSESGQRVTLISAAEGAPDGNAAAKEGSPPESSQREAGRSSRIRPRPAVVLTNVRVRRRDLQPGRPGGRVARLSRRERRAQHRSERHPRRPGRQPRGLPRARPAAGGARTGSQVGHATACERGRPTAGGLAGMTDCRQILPSVSGQRVLGIQQRQ